MTVLRGVWDFLFWRLVNMVNDLKQAFFVTPPSGSCNSAADTSTKEMISIVFTGQHYCIYKT